MAYHIEVAHTRHRFLSSRDKRKVIVNRIESGLLNLWIIEDSEEQPYKYIRSFQDKGLALVSPNKHGGQIELLSLNALRNTDSAKWKIIPVQQIHGMNYPGSIEHDNCVFVISKLVPPKSSVRLRHVQHEIGAQKEITHNNTRVILWNHQGVNVEEPRNQMWIMHKQPRN